MVGKTNMELVLFETLGKEAKSFPFPPYVAPEDLTL